MTTMDTRVADVLRQYKNNENEHLLLQEIVLAFMQGPFDDIYEFAVSFLIATSIQIGWVGPDRLWCRKRQRSCARVNAICVWWRRRITSQAYDTPRVTVMRFVSRGYTSKRKTSVTHPLLIFLLWTFAYQNKLKTINEMSSPDNVPKRDDINLDKLLSNIAKAGESVGLIHTNTQSNFTALEYQTMAEWMRYDSEPPLPV
jgi:hypothetical protein